MEPSRPEPSPVSEASRAAPAPTTPPSIYLGIVLMLFAIAAPFIGEYAAMHTEGDSWRTLGVIMKWLFITAVAALGGIVSTLVGARHGAHTLVTKMALVLCVVMVLALLVIFSGGL
jgi:hypothetical protein